MGVLLLAGSARAQIGLDLYARGAATDIAISSGDDPGLADESYLSGFANGYQVPFGESGSGSWIVGGNFCNSNCSFPGGGLHGLALAWFDADEGVFRADLTAVGDAEASVGLAVLDQITPLSALILDIHLDHSLVAITTGDSSSGGAFLDYAIYADDVEIFSFGAGRTSNATGDSSEWGVFVFETLVDGGNGSSNTLDLSVALPWNQPFALRIEAHGSAGCVYDIVDEPNDTCYAAANFANSAYVGIRGEYISEQGFAYRGYPVPEPNSSALLALAGMALAGVRARAVSR